MLLLRDRPRDHLDAAIGAVFLELVAEIADERGDLLGATVSPHAAMTTRSKVRRSSSSKTPSAFATMYAPSTMASKSATASGSKPVGTVASPEGREPYDAAASDRIEPVRPARRTPPAREPTARRARGG